MRVRTFASADLSLTYCGSFYWRSSKKLDGLKNDDMAVQHSQCSNVRTDEECWDPAAEGSHCVVTASCRKGGQKQYSGEKTIRGEGVKEGNYHYCGRDYKRIFRQWYSIYSVVENIYLHTN